MTRILPTFATAVLAMGCARSGMTEQTVKHGPHDHAGNHGHDGHTDAPEQNSGSLIIRADPAATPGKAVSLQLMIHAPDGSMVTDFDIVHEQKVHLIIIREGLDQFAHIHPSVDAAGNLSVTHTFPSAGTYSLIADYQPKGGRGAIARGTLRVPGNAPTSPAIVPNVPGEVSADGFRADVTVTPSTGGMTHITFALRFPDGRPVTNLDRYLGEYGHAVFVSADGNQFVHVHPGRADAATGTITFQVHFPTAGIYKGWGQFQHNGRVVTIPIVMKYVGSQAK
jgi:hypothetical protein